ncbi:endonuclease domain-containing protein [Dermabacter sp. p3-SID358]|uniref:endonuclease domain-containing protein n=1 Tax=Dermabacter sp. p3-SID358 TaxID=2916114 RepID=UPI0021A493F1|nr:endonuclease domain-containing protein [Dermabacter sp. p3-SID358]MCT1867190.1 endonuclease domain-containing protein [Dermabacter sp. p3-SID358]
MHPNQPAPISTIHQLQAAGWTVETLDAALKTGQMMCVGRHEYLPRNGTPPIALEAGRLGCWVTCFDALRLYGLWIPPMDLEKRHFTSTRRRLESGRASADTIGHHRHLQRKPHETGGIVMGLEDALIEAVRCGSPEQAFIVLESALAKRLITEDSSARILAGASKRKAQKIGTPRSLSDSGTESALAFRLTRKNIKFRQQVAIEDVGRVDILIGNSLVIELDSWEFHDADRTAYHRDRARDAVLTARGYTVVRLTYEHVFFKWEKYEQLLDEFIRNGLHTRPVRGHA